MKFLLGALLIFGGGALGADFDWAPKAPGKAATSSTAGLSNSALLFSQKGNSFILENRWTHESLTPDVNAELTMRDGRKFRVPLDLTHATRQVLVSNTRSARASDHKSGICLESHQSVAGASVDATYDVRLKDDCAYVTIQLTLSAEGKDADVSSIRMVSLPDGNVEGQTPGSPLVSGDFYAGIEYPMATAAEGSCSVERKLPIRDGNSITYTAVLGVAPKGQMRRAFLAYVESARAHPYRPFLHYNSWYDVGYFSPYNETDCLDRINKFGHELVEKRGVKMSSFLFDDGWDNHESVWEFNKGFPNGFLPLRDAAAKYGAGPGVWLSPWGGYGPPREQRLAYGKAHGMEVDDEGYALSGANYYARFKAVTEDFVTSQGINQFKLDGTGSADKKGASDQFESDFDAAIALIGDLRKASPDLFINLTTGTWPSPFWLQYADSIWRGGEDHSFAGVGTWRQKWITYRDGDTYHGVVQRGPLYPINSLMLHGIIYAQHAQHLGDDPGHDFRDEVHDYFGTATQLQEMYITPDLLTSQNWDDLAEAAKWSRANADVLRDTHWVGGDPTKLEVYGWGSWNARKGILVLRNPSDKPQTFSVDVAALLELPPSTAKVFEGRSPWKGTTGAYRFVAGTPQDVELKPFEVLTLDLNPRR
jgi:hypothetical protein